MTTSGKDYNVCQLLDCLKFYAFPHQNSLTSYHRNLYIDSSLASFHSLLHIYAIVYLNVYTIVINFQI